MVVHSKRQSLHLHWTAERKIRQILQERLEKNELHLIYKYLFVRLIFNWSTQMHIAATRIIYFYKHLMWKIYKAECSVSQLESATDKERTWLQILACRDCESR